jgi:hypothetical protein
MYVFMYIYIFFFLVLNLVSDRLAVYIPGDNTKKVNIFVH